MASLGSILSIAASALRAGQAAVHVTAHNIANAETEGYSRQRPVLAEGFPVATPDGMFGTGVRLRDIERVRDELTNRSFRRENALAREFATRSELLGRAEALLGEPQDRGLASELDAFFSAWSELATHPSSQTARTVLRDRADQVAERFRSLAAGLDQLRQDAEDRLASSVDRINAIAEGVARLNRDIVAAETGGRTAGDLRDARDRLLDELSGLTPVTVFPRGDGSVGVQTSGISLVDGPGYGRVEIRPDGGQLRMALVGHPGTLPESGGVTGALLVTLNQELPAIRADLDALAAALVEDVNAIHRTGMGVDGSTDVPFFDPGGVTASSIRLSDEVRADVRAIAAGTADEDDNPRPGANDIALLLAGLRDRPLSLTGEAPGAGYRTLVSRVGVSLRSIVDRELVHRTLAEQADIQRSSISGVSTEEEMTRLIRFQAAYAAAARVVTAADEMMEAVLRM